MIDGNTAALEAYMREQDRADAIFEEYNTPSNRDEAEEWVLDNQYLAIIDVVLDDPADEVNHDILCVLAEIAYESIEKTSKRYSLLESLQGSDWFNRLVDDRMKRKAGLDD